MITIVVAGGRGTRLKPLTNQIPKPMVKVNDKPILEHILVFFKKQGIKNFIFALCYKPKIITDHFKNGKDFGVNIRYTFENKNQPLGTAGAILLAKKYIQKTFIVTYADILRKLNLKKIIKFHQKNHALATLVSYQHFNNPKSIIVFNKRKQITQFIERPTTNQIKKYQNANGSVWSNASFYILEPKILKYIPPNQKSDFGFDIFPQTLLLKEKLMVYPSFSYFIDIADITALKKAEATFPQIKPLR